MASKIATKMGICVEPLEEAMALWAPFEEFIDRTAAEGEGVTALRIRLVDVHRADAPEMGVRAFRSTVRLERSPATCASPRKRAPSAVTAYCG